MIAGQLTSEQPYSNLKRSISVVIVDFLIYPNDDLIQHKFHLNEDTTGEIFSNILKIHGLELPKALI